MEWANCNNTVTVTVSFPTLIHESVGVTLASSIFKKQSEEGNPLGNIAPGGSPTLYLPNKTSWVPDFTVMDKSAKESPLPTVVLETSYTQSHINVIKKAVQYLGGSEGLIQLVIIANIIGGDVSTRDLTSVAIETWRLSQIYNIVTTSDSETWQWLDECKASIKTTQTQDSRTIRKLETRGPYFYRFKNKVYECGRSFYAEVIFDLFL